MTRRISIRILAIDLTYNGFGFAVLEQPLRLADWGYAVVWSQSDLEFLARIETLLERYRPSVVALERIEGAPHRRRTAARARRVCDYCKTAKIAVIATARSELARLFGPAASKFDIAGQIADAFPELKSRMPNKRRPWENEDERMHIFDALSWGLAALTGGRDALAAA